MKFTVVLIIAIAAVVNLTNAKNINKTELPAFIRFSDDDKISREIPAFVQSLRNQQRAPPIEEESRTRATVVTTEWIEQKLDHFDENEAGTWQMRYLINAEHYKDGGPMFIYVGGEWDVTPVVITNGLFVDMAKEHNAILFATEHRYYGESKPKDDITVENLKYLHVKQALADLAHFVRHKRESVPALANAKVVMGGCSYSASMIVWFKQLYPELLTAGWASSAPLLAKVDFREFNEEVGRAVVELGSRKCYERIQNGVTELEWMFANKRAAEAKAMMKICNTFDENNDLDLWTLFGTISNIVGNIVQFQQEGHVPNICNYLMGFEDDVEAVTSLVLFAYGNRNCIESSYKNSLNFYFDSSYKYGMVRPWYYQTCNEYGWYKNTASPNQPFGTKVPYELYTTLCADIFGDVAYTNANIHAKAAQTNAEFGGMSAKVDKIFMTQGGSDPWSPIGHGNAEGANVIPRTSHCADLNSIGAADSAEMRATKERLVDSMREWLKD